MKNKLTESDVKKCKSYYKDLTEEQKLRFRQALRFSNGKSNTDLGIRMASVDASPEDIGRVAQLAVGEYDSVHNFVKYKNPKDNMFRELKKLRNSRVRSIVKQALKAVPDYFDTIEGKAVIENGLKKMAVEMFEESNTRGWREDEFSNLGSFQGYPKYPAFCFKAGGVKEFCTKLERMGVTVLPEFFIWTEPRRVEKGDFAKSIKTVLASRKYKSIPENIKAGVFKKGFSTVRSYGWRNSGNQDKPMFENEEKYYEYDLESYSNMSQEYADKMLNEKHHSVRYVGSYSIMDQFRSRWSICSNEQKTMEANCLLDTAYEALKKMHLGVIEFDTDFRGGTSSQQPDPAIPKEELHEFRYPTYGIAKELVVGTIKMARQYDKMLKEGVPASVASQTVAEALNEKAQRKLDASARSIRSPEGRRRIVGLQVFSRVDINDESETVKAKSKSKGSTKSNSWVIHEEEQ